MAELFNIKVIKFWWGITCQFTSSVKSPPPVRYKIDLGISSILDLGSIFANHVGTNLLIKLIRSISFYNDTTSYTDSFNFGVFLFCAFRRHLTWNWP